MMVIHFIRHGKTEANEKRLYYGKTDLPLSENGAETIRRLKDEGIYPEAERFYTSGLLRAEQTLNIIYGTAARTTIPELEEYHFGAFEMKNYEELKSDDAYQSWIMDETGDVACPGGESKNEFRKRVINGYGKICTDCTAAVITHGGVISVLMDMLFPGEKNHYEWQPEPGRGYTVTRVSERLHIYKSI